MGDFVPAALKFDEGENVIAMIPCGNYESNLIFVFENGNVAKVPISAYQTKTNRKRLANAYSDKSPLVGVYVVDEDADLALMSTNGRMIIFNTALILPKTTRNTQGVRAMNVKAGAKVHKSWILPPEELTALARYQVKNIPVVGLLLKDGDDPDQMKLV